jgi:hypothetical protein
MRIPGPSMNSDWTNPLRRSGESRRHDLLASSWSTDRFYFESFSRLRRERLVPDQALSHKDRTMTALRRANARGHADSELSTETETSYVCLQSFETAEIWTVSTDQEGRRGCAEARAEPVSRP